MTPEISRELARAWNAGLLRPVAELDLTPLGQLRAAWVEASNVERAIFKAEIGSAR
jgi:hypothetical protein